MNLIELFEDRSIFNDMREKVIDYITPLIAHKIPFVTVDSLYNEIQKFTDGLSIDKDFIMDLLNDNSMVAKIEDGKVFFDYPDEDKDTDDKTQEKNIDNIKKTAIKQAQKKVS